MKNWKRSAALFLSGAMALSLFACKPDGGTDYPDDPSATPTGEIAAADPDPTPSIEVDLSQGVLEFSAGMSGSDTALTVNGEDVPADLFLYWLDYNCYYFSAYYGMYGLTVADYADDLLEDAIGFCTSEVLLRQKAAELGCLPTDAQVADAKAQVTGEDGQDTYELLRSAYGLSDASIDYLFLSDAYYANVMDAVTQEMGDDELDQYLADNGVFSVKHILLMVVDQETMEPLSDEEVAAKKETADDLLAQLQAADDLEAKFDELMHAYSEDSGLDYYPDGYTYDSTASLVGGFREAALELEPGQISGIVETDYGYHILLRLPVDDASRAEYRDGARSQELNDLIDQWAEDAQIDRADALSSLDVASFFDRIMAYQQALSDQDAQG